MTDSGRAAARSRRARRASVRRPRATPRRRTVASQPRGDPTVAGGRSIAARYASCSRSSASWRSRTCVRASERTHARSARSASSAGGTGAGAASMGVTRRMPAAPISIAAAPGSPAKRGPCGVGGRRYDPEPMAPRIGRRDVVWLGLLSGAFVLLAVNVLFGTRGFDKPNAGLVWRLVEAPGIALGWGGVALLVVTLPYALLAWVRGKSPGKVLAVFGTLV